MNELEYLARLAVAAYRFNPPMHPSFTLHVSECHKLIGDGIGWLVFFRACTAIYNPLS